MSLIGTVWAPKGPSPITDGGQRNNGMVTAIAVHPNDSDIVYVGTAGGGVWKSADAGVNWRPLFDRQLALGIGEPAAVAIDPNDADILYVGTSGRGRVSPQRQIGLFKSFDGGASWRLLGSGYPAGNVGNVTRFANELINTIIVDPANSQTVYLASSTGVWRSIDGGMNWTQGVGSNGDVRSLVLDRTSPANARILYGGVSGVGVIRSNDGGRNWTQILTSATPAVATALGAVAGTLMNQVVLDLAPPTAPPAAGGIRVIYVAIAGSHPTAATFPDPVGLFMSTDQGATWTQRAATGGPGTSYSGYTLTIAVDPASPGDGANDILYYGTLSQARSTNSGATFTGLTNLHADTHAWAFSPQAAPTPTIVFCGNDGGISRSTDNGATWTPRNAGGLQTTLFYNIDLKPDATASATAGALQDNRLEISTGGPGWNTVAGGDGWDIVYDGTTANRLFATTNSGTAPQTRLLRSTNDGAAWSDITPWPNTGTEAGFYLSSLAADPSAAGIIYAATNQNLWQTRDGGGTWRTLFTAIPSFFITATTAVAPTNGNNVVVANGGQVFVSANALAPTVGGPTGVTFTNITRNLPGRTVLRAVFDPNDLTVIYAVLGGFAGVGAAGHVFRTTIGGTAWTNISPALDVPFGAIALDGTDTPTAIYVGTDFGVLRSIDRGATWYVLDDIHFPRCPVTDLAFGRGSRILRAATYGRGVFEFTKPTWPTIAVNLEAGLNFGTRCQDPAYLTLEVFNVGTGPLVVSSVQRLMGSTGFQVLANPGTPLTIDAGEHVDFTVAFTGTTPGSTEQATIRIVSNDPNAPVVDLLATAVNGTASLETAIANAGSFGEVCLGSFVDRDLVLNNRGPCALRIAGMTSTSPAFQVPGVVSFPLVVSAGDSIAVPIRFQPTGRGNFSGTLRITSNDLASPALVQVSGVSPSPRLVAMVPDTGAFADTCLGDFHDEMITLNNAGHCPLTITAIASSSGDFLVPQTIVFPIVIASGGDLEFILRFKPSHFGPSGGTISIVSDDPASPLAFAVSGNTPSGVLTLTGTTGFGGVELGQRALQTLSICNTGHCDLHVTKVAFLPPCPCDEVKRKPCGCPQPCGCHEAKSGDPDKQHPHHKSDQCCLNFRIVTNPFPATVRPGSCLGVLISYVPTCDSAACCELVIESDDPNQPSRKVFVTGHLRRTLRSALKCWAAQELNDILRAGNC